LGVELEEAKTKVLGRTLVKLEGDRRVCGLQECNLGNYIT